MAEAQIFKFTFEELADLMVRELHLSEGLWGLYMRFGIAAGNTGSGLEDLKPTAVVPVLEIGLQRFDEPSNLTVDAAEINKPARAKVKRSKVSA